MKKKKRPSAAAPVLRDTGHLIHSRDGVSNLVQVTTLSLFPYLGCVCVRAQLLSCVWLCDPMVCSLPGFSVLGIFQARILQWVSISCSRESSWPRDWIRISYIFCIGRWIFYHCPTNGNSNGTNLVSLLWGLIEIILCKYGICQILWLKNVSSN